MVFFSLFSLPLHPLSISIYSPLFFFPWLSALCLSFSHFHLPTQPLLFSATLLHFMTCRRAALWLSAFFFFLSFTIVTCQIVRNDPSEILGIGHGFYAGQHDIRLWRLWSQLTVLVGCFTSVMSCFGIFIDKLNWNGTALILTMFFLGNLQKSSVRYCQKSLMILEICLNRKIVAKLIQRAPWLKWTVSSASP